MTRRTKNINIVDEDVLLIHPKDAAYRELNTGDIGRLYSGRGEVALKVEVTDKVKEGIVFTTFHFPEHMVNMVTGCLLYTSPSPRDRQKSRMPSSA